MSGAAGKRRRTALNPANPEQGSAFYELVVAPTLDPQNARPYNDPLTGQVFNPAAAQAQGAEEPSGGAGGDDSAHSDSDIEIESAVSAKKPAPNALFFIHVTKSFTDAHTMTSKRANAKKIQSESKTVPSGAVDVFAYSRGSFVTLALTAHDLEDDYLAGLRGPVISRESGCT